MTKNIENILSL